MFIYQGVLHNLCIDQVRNSSFWAGQTGRLKGKCLYDPVWMYEGLLLNFPGISQSTLKKKTIPDESILDELE